MKTIEEVVKELESLGFTPADIDVPTDQIPCLSYNILHIGLVPISLQCYNVDHTFLLNYVMDFNKYDDTGIQSYSWGYRKNILDRWNKITEEVTDIPTLILLYGNLS